MTHFEILNQKVLVELDLLNTVEKIPLASVLELPMRLEQRLRL